MKIQSIFTVILLIVIKINFATLIENRQLFTNKQNQNDQDTGSDSSRVNLIRQLEDQSSTDLNTKVIIKTRYTENNYKCQIPFFYKNKTYDNCISEVTPDGSMGTKEWCIMEVSPDNSDILATASLNSISGGNIKADGTSDYTSWGYCKPILEYNSLKKEVQDLRVNLATFTDKISEVAGKDLEPGKNVLYQIRNIGKNQEKLTLDLSNMKSEQKYFYDKIKLVGENNKIIQTMENKISDEKLKREKFIENKLSLGKNKADNLKSNSLNSDGTGKVNSENIKEKNFDCTGVEGYTDTNFGDGLMGKYYDNEYFSGYYKEKVDFSIDFNWTGNSPLNEINNKNFSIIWEGYLYIPITSNYKFKIISDGGVYLEINFEVLIEHNTNSALDCELEKEISNESDYSNIKDKPFEAESNDIFLTGGSKYFIKVKYFHSTHYFMHESNEDIYLTLLWKNQEFDFQRIHPHYFYQINSFSDLKIGDFDTSIMTSSVLAENDFFFNKSKLYILQDVPTEFLLSPILKMNFLYDKDFIEFSINTPSIVYVIFPASGYDFLDSDFMDTQLDMSLLIIKNMEGKVEDKNKDIRSIDSIRMKVYSKSYIIGKVKININKKGFNYKDFPSNASETDNHNKLLENNKNFCKHVKLEDFTQIQCIGIPLMVILKFDEKSSIPKICDGEEIVPSDSNKDNKYFLSCSSSSHKPNNSCMEGLNREHKDQYGGMWISNTEGIGAWMTVNFTKIFELTKMRIRNRMNISSRTSEITLKFQKGETNKIKLKNDSEINEIKLDRIKTNTVKMTISGVYNSLSNGFSVEFYGFICESAQEKILNKNSKYPVFSMDFNGSNKMDKEGINNNLTSDIKDKIKNYSAFFFDEYTNNNSIIPLDCSDTLATSSKFIYFDFIVQTIIKVKCFSNCLFYPIKVYGDIDNYSLDSSICKAAIHSGIIDINKDQNNSVVLQINFSKNNKNFQSSFSNGVQSFKRNMTPISFKISKFYIEEKIKLEKGSKIEYLISIKSKDSDKNQNDLSWVLATIIEASLISLKQEKDKGYKLKIQYTHSNLITTKETIYPNYEINPCGTNIKGIDCKSSLNYFNNDKILIIFVDKKMESLLNIDEALFDNGLKYGKNNFPYGWSKDLVNNQNEKDKNRIRNPFLFDENIEDVKFRSSLQIAAHQKSLECIKPNPTVDCENASYAIWTGIGEFKVKIGIGNNISKNFTANLSINNKQVLSEKMKTGVMKEFEFTVIAENEYLIFSSTCLIDCKDSILYISYIQIETVQTKKIDYIANSLKKAETTAVGCNSIVNGRCITGIDVENCLFAHENVYNANMCFGDFHLVEFKRTNKNLMNCPEIIGMKKCVRKIYISDESCDLNCPVKCINLKCN